VSDNSQFCAHHVSKYSYSRYLSVNKEYSCGVFFIKKPRAHAEWCSMRTRTRASPASNPNLTQIDTHRHTQTHTDTHRHTQRHTHTLTHTHKHVYIHTHTRTHARTHTHNTFIYIPENNITRQTLPFLSLSLSYINTHTHTHTHTHKHTHVYRRTTSRGRLSFLCHHET